MATLIGVCKVGVSLQLLKSLLFAIEKILAALKINFILVCLHSVAVIAQSVYIATSQKQAD